MSLSNKRFRVYSSRDVTGVELAGALKNVIAIGAGILEGKGLGINAVSALVVRAMLEMQEFVELYQADPKTIFGLAGMGDMVIFYILMLLNVYEL